MKKETYKPIIFSTPMVRAILAGNKTETRRVMKPQPDQMKICVNVRTLRWHIFNGSEFNLPVCPFGVIGGRLWVREKFTVLDDGYVMFAANHPEKYLKDECGDVKWKPSIHMPERFARLILLVEEILIEPLQSINQTAIVQEGAASKTDNAIDAKAKWVMLWDSINEKRGFGWDTNPWVWVVRYSVDEIREMK